MHQNFLKYAAKQHSEHVLTNNNACKKKKNHIAFENLQATADVLTLVSNFCCSATLWIAVVTKRTAQKQEYTKGNISLFRISPIAGILAS